MTTHPVRPDLFAYSSRRSDIHARNVVATSQPLATQAGIDMLRNGGNAVDAALAAAICLTVVEPTGNGIGSDAFAIILNEGKLAGFNGSGRAPTAWHRDRFAHLHQMPTLGWDAVTVPGAVDTWVKLSKRYGRVPFAELFEAAIHYARNGFAVTPVVQRLWDRSAESLGHFDGFRSTFLPGGSAPSVGELFVNPHQADTLQEIARTGGESFYRGALADAMISDARHHDAVMSHDDLASHAGSWVEPVSIDYGRLRVYELPPNGQGLAALIALGILKHLDLDKRAVDSADALHLQIEAMKRAFVDTRDHVADPDQMSIGVSELLDPDRLRTLAGQIDEHQAWMEEPNIAYEQGTVYLCTADERGAMVSMIQSNFHGFGSGIVVPQTGISLQNRGSGFNLQEHHPNCVAGGKRPFHTIIPGYLEKHGKPFGAFGVMGGHMQPQGHVQLVCRLENWGQSLQEALDAPRWHVSPNFELNIESGFAESVVSDLVERGHRVNKGHFWGVFGGAQAILVTDAGYQGASDPRKDGSAAGF